MRTHRSTRAMMAIALIASLSVGLAACGDDDTAFSNSVRANNAENNAPNNAENNAPNNAENNAPNNAENNAPNNAPNNTPTGEVDGAPCQSDADCAGATCFEEGDGYPEGYCSTADCAGGVSCNGGQCAFLDSSREESACFATCETAEDCREGYLCQTFGDTGLCLPDEPEPESRDDDEPCTSDDQCAGGTCLSEEDGFPDGACTTINCRDRNDCAGEGRACLQAGNPNFCIRLCETADDCREGYICQPVNGGAYCAPSPAGGTNIPEEGELPFDLVCGETLQQRDAFQGGLDRHVQSFNIPDDATSFMVVPYSSGSQIYPVSLDGPARDLNFFNEYNFALANAGFLINLTPLLIPQAPQFSDAVGGGDYTLTMASNSDLCRYVISKSGQGSQIDLNIYFVGVRGINAQSAEQNAGFQQALERFDTIFDAVNVDIRRVIYRDVTGNDETRYRIVRSQEAAFNLVATSETPGETADEALSVNVFFIDQFAISGGSVLGISAGLPGAAGLHGTRGSGLVFAATVLGDPNLLGQVLAHEVGHYLGLFHTSEQGGRSFDPLSDTPQCPGNQWNNPGGCPDINNLMFPFAGNTNTNISEAQGQVLQANPLIK